MTELSTTFEQKPDTEVAPAAVPVAAKPAEAPTLITEQQVLFSTAAAVALPRPKARRGVLGWLMNAAAPPAPRQEPKRYVWLENALMSREMDRL
ncbi:hypothetical protein [Mycobacterium sp.]|uniref:hypothetical protein n=1 Tax=Mycobacterium sp. TaxID=1785 RepID=UPI002DB4DA64|nr:hypothetical protein [Mycobacterium sp.]